MVLLNPIISFFIINIKFTLTFHYGAIEPTYVEEETLDMFLLTFHYGAIEPTKVAVAKLLTDILTFHYGAIEPPLALKPLYI